MRSKRIVVLGATGAAVLITGGATAWGAIIPGVDSIYPTSNASWTCTTGSLGAGPFCKTDNSSLTYGYDSSVTPDQRTVYQSVLNNQYNPTDLSVSFDSTPVLTGSSETDIVYKTGNPGAGANGTTWCDDAVSGSQCDQHYIVVTSSRITSTSGTPCHETGHAVGLTHGGNSSPTVSDSNSNLECMRAPSGSITTLGAHNTAQINGEY
jgi:hypothetical protein